MPRVAGAEPAIGAGVVRIARPVTVFAA